MNSNQYLKLLNNIKTKESNKKLKEKLEANILEYLELIKEKENYKSYKIKKEINYKIIKLKIKIEIKKKILNLK